ncbi:hypothetical protein [Streptomyces sp. NPDC088348]|uniref:hypothetical protein n=1 Tax=Streptomyces sp. NPDC088348 TaxID=3365853 RepID=UPI0038102432
MTTPCWDDLPPALRALLLDRFTPTGPPEPVDGGFTPGVRVRLPSPSGGGVFVKAIRADNAQAPMYRNEATANAVLPPGVGPRMLMSVESHGWVTLVFEYVNGRHPELSPGSPDVDAVMSALGGLHERLTPCPLATAPDITDAVTGFAHALTDYWTGRAQQGGPALRAYRARAAKAGRAWTGHRTG